MELELRQTASIFFSRLRLGASRAALGLSLALGTGPAIANAQSSEVLASVETVRAANADAARQLRDQLGRMSLSPNWTVAAFVQRLNADQDFDRLIEGANQVGAPRWANDTCQVQLELPVVRVSQALKQLAVAQPKLSPLSAAQIEMATRRWPIRTFEATGSSALPAALAQIKPCTDDRWSLVGEEARQKALARAADAAALRVIDGVRTVQISNQTLADNLKVPAIETQLRSWLSSRPITRVDFRPEYEVEVTLALQGEDFAQVLRETLEAQDAPVRPPNEAGWLKFTGEVAKRTLPAVGRARAVPDGPRTKPAAVMKLPAAAPEWAAEEITVSGRAVRTGNALKTIAAADADAAATLLARVRALPLNQGLTVGQFADQNRAAADAVDRFVRQSRTLKTSQAPDGSATVQLRADLHELWDELRK